MAYVCTMNRRVARKLDFSLHEAVGSTQPQWKIHIPGRVQAGKRTSKKHGGRRCISIVPIRMGSLENVKFPIVGQVVLGTTTHIYLRTEKDGAPLISDSRGTKSRPAPIGCLSTALVGPEKGALRTVSP